MSTEATHVLILWYPADRIREEEREIREIFGPLTEQSAKSLGTTLHNLTGVPFEVVALKPAPLTLTDAGRREMR